MLTCGSEPSSWTRPRAPLSQGTQSRYSAQKRTMRFRCVTPQRSQARGKGAATVGGFTSPNDPNWKNRLTQTTGLPDYRSPAGQWSHKKKMTGRAGGAHMPRIGTGEGCRNGAARSARRRGVERLLPGTSTVTQPAPQPLGQPPFLLPPALQLPRPAPCCRTRRWQARWCSCPRTNPPQSCQPAAGPTSAGRPWPLWSIRAASPQWLPARAAAGHTVRLPLYAVPGSLRTRRLPAGLPSPRLHPPATGAADPPRPRPRESRSTAATPTRGGS